MPALDVVAPSASYFCFGATPSACPTACATRSALSSCTVGFPRSSSLTKRMPVPLASATSARRSFSARRA
jgi:hypothetical protein